MLSFLNIFMIPVISLSIFSRRSYEPLTADIGTLVRYCLFAIGVSIGTYFVLQILKSAVGIEPLVESQLYTIIAAIVAFLLPYIVEICMKYIDIRCEIKKKKE